MLVQWLLSVWLENRTNNWLQTVLGFCHTQGDLTLVLDSVRDRVDEGGRPLPLVAVSDYFLDIHGLISNEIGVQFL